MTSILRVNNFSVAANQAYGSAKYLCTDSQSLGVRQVDLPKSFSSQAAKENRETWKIFRQSLVDTIGPTKFDWICHRYRSQLNFTRMQKSGEALLPVHVELFSVGVAQVLSRDIKAKFPEKIKTLTREEITQKIRQVQPFPIVGGYKDPCKISGSPGTLFANFFHDKLLMDKEKQLLFSDTERLTFPAWLERMCKVTVNRELIEGQLIPAPGQDGQMDYYKVYRKIGGSGLVSYALKPATIHSTLKPLIVFRPTQWAFSNEDSFDSYLNDVQPNVGEMGWMATRKQFEYLMNDPHFRRNNEKISIGGYSLGGAHEQYFLANHSEHVSYAAFYNDPSITEQVSEDFAEKMKELPPRTEPLNIQLFRTKGDFCHYVGGKHVGWGVDRPDVNIQLLEIDPDKKTAAAFKLHSHRIFDNTHFPYQIKICEETEELFNHLDNSKRGADVFWYERMRRLWGRVAFLSFSCLSVAIKGFSRVFGIRILRSSTQPDL